MTYYVLVSNYNENVKVNDLCQRYGGINMAKKVRFPLEMEDGVEVRSMEELRDNFSLSRLLEYFNDGRLVTWLQDRYENTIAEEIAAINPNEEDVEKKICEVLDVKYDENTSEEEGMAEERKRKLELLKEYPDAMKYAKNVDYVAFDQDDLYDLLDGDAKEIYLCGKRFSVPISKGNTKYIGIIDGVEVVIEAKQPVDFESKSISFVNCQFDEKYRKIVGAEEKNLSVIAENKENKADSKFDIFNDIFEAEYKEKFDAAGIEYFYTLIDDAVARVMRSEGGYIWACKNYDGDVMSDMVATAFGSLSMMTSVLASPKGYYEYEAAHGTVQRHYYKYLKGEETSTNPIATIFAWSGALRKRGEIDNLPKLMAFADKLEKACIDTIENGEMTGDLYLISTLENKKKLNTEEFILAIRKTLESLMD